MLTFLFFVFFFFSQEINLYAVNNSVFHFFLDILLEGRWRQVFKNLQTGSTRMEENGTKSFDLLHLTLSNASGLVNIQTISYLYRFDLLFSMWMPRATY